MDILSNLVLVSNNLVEAKLVLLEGGYTEEAANKAIEATGFETLSRFWNLHLDDFMEKNSELLREQITGWSQDIKVVIVVTQTNTRKIPNAASALQAVLGLGEDVLCLEIVDGCNGFVKALHVADRLLDEGGVAVIFAGEINSLMVARAPAGTSALFGDGFALTTVRKSATFSSEIRQRGAKGGVIRFGALDPALAMDGFEVFAFSSREVPRLMKAIADNGFGKMRFPVFHQASKLIVEQIAKRVGFDGGSSPVFSAGRIGNLGAGSIPSWLAQQEFLPPGSEVIAVGFGAGLSWGYANVHWHAERNELVHV